MKGSGVPVQALPGVVGDQGCGLLQVAGGVTVVVRLELLGLSWGGADHLREHREAAAGHVDVLLELAQDRGEFLTVDVVGVQIVLDLLKGELGNTARGANPVQAHARTAGHGLVALGG
ncbi:hypothetical protein ACFT38_28620 [Streptomyces sp. NPDC056975]|uniref:hypothetical protein n=1 Tax=Streptomyces sp. NPDC056975 TaxID=3345985 RepID=UPI003625E84D